MKNNVVKSLENHDSFSTSKPSHSTIHNQNHFRNEICFHPKVGLIQITTDSIRVLDIHDQHKYKKLIPQVVQYHLCMVGLLIQMVTFLQYKVYLFVIHSTF